MTGGTLLLPRMVRSDQTTLRSFCWPRNDTAQFKCPLFESCSIQPLQLNAVDLESGPRAKLELDW